MARLCAPPTYQRHRPEDAILYCTLERHLETFRARASDQGGGDGLPAFVTRELRAYLRCGRLEHGCVHVRCEQCGDEMVVAFSCKGRGFCPSCGGRRMSELAAQLVDRVIPRVPVRQWVLSLPFTLRYQLAFDATLTAAVLGVSSAACSPGCVAPRPARESPMPSAAPSPPSSAEQMPLLTGYAAASIQAVIAAGPPRAGCAPPRPWSTGLNSAAPTARGSPPRVQTEPKSGLGSAWAAIAIMRSIEVMP